MTFESYVVRLFSALQVTCQGPYSASDELYEGLGLDSLQAFELILFTEEIAGLSVPPASVPMIFTLGDAYDYYLKSCDAALREDQFEEQPLQNDRKI